MAERVTVEFVGKDGVSGPAQSASKGLEGLRTSADKAGFSVSSAFGNMAKQAASFALGIGVFKIASMATAGLGDSIIGLNARLEQADMAFTTMLGSAQASKKFLDDLAKFAAKTPFEFPELVDATKRLMAFGFKAQEVLPLMTSIGNAAAALGGGAFMIQRITTALGQMSAKGKVAGQEMLQLAESGIPAWEMLAKKLGVDVAEAMKRVENRAVDARVMIEAFQEGTAAKFGDMMGKQARTFSGAMSTVKDSLQMAVANGFKPFFDRISAGVVQLADFLSGESFAKFASTLASAMASIATPVDILIRAIGGLLRIMTENKVVATVMIGLLAALATGYAIAGARALAYALATNVVRMATITWTLVQTALNVALSANPIGVVVMALAGLAAGIVYAYNTIKPFKDAVDAAWNALKSIAQSLGITKRETNDYTESLLTLHSVVDRTSDAYKRQIDALRKKTDTLRGTKDQSDEFTASVDKSREAIDKARTLTLSHRASSETLKITIIDLTKVYDQMSGALDTLQADMRATDVQTYKSVQATRDLIREEERLYQQILNRLSAQELIDRATTDDVAEMEQFNRGLRGIGEGSRWVTDQLSYLRAQMTDLRQVESVYGRDSAQVRNILNQMAPSVSDLSTRFKDLTGSQKVDAASLIGDYRNITSSLENMAQSAAKAMQTEATKDYSDSVKLLRGQMTALKDATDRYGVSSEQAQSIAANVQVNLESLKASYSDLSAIQQQEVDNLASSFEKLGEGAKQNLKDVGFSVQEITTALIANHPAMALTSAQVKLWQERIASVNIALIANRDQMQAAQRDLAGMQERLGDLNRQLSEAKQRFSDLSRPKLTGMGQLEDQIFAIEYQLKRLGQAELTGLPIEQIIKMFPMASKGAEQFLRTLPGTKEELQKVLETLRNTQGLKFDEQLRLLGKAAEDSSKEMSFQDALKGLSATKSEINSLSAAIANQEGAIRGQQNAIALMQQASDALNRTLAEYQVQLKGAEDKQNLVSKALQLGYKWLLEDKDKFIELGVTGVEQAGIIDAETRKLLNSIAGAADDTTAQSTTTLATMVQNYETAMLKGIMAVQGSDGKGGLVGTNKILADSIDTNAIKAQGLADILNSLQSRELTITTNYVNTYSVGGFGGPVVPEIGGAMGGWFKVPGFQTGGAFTVGGLPGADSVGVAFRAKPGEVVSIQQPGQTTGGNIILNNPTFWGLGEFEDMVIKARQRLEMKGRW